MLTLWQDELEDQKEAIVKKDGAIADLERQLKDKDSHIGVRVFFFFCFFPFFKTDKFMASWCVSSETGKMFESQCFWVSLFNPKKKF